ncbi:MAG TPA: DUF3426 domain-containing protein [Symbiobacteriaceae bacterium]|nr:DUF3426 domain-containing protein [Symbiobacteriaceae bacterium]
MKRNWYRTSTGSLIITGEFVNTTGSAQENPTVTVTLTDESGSIVAERSGSTVPKVLPANGRGFFAVDTGLQPAAVASMEVTVAFDAPTKATLVQRDISQWASTVSDRALTAKGAFTNTYEDPMYGPRVAVVIRDALRKILWADEYVHPSWVIPKEQATWSLTLATAPVEVKKNVSSVEALLVFRQP